MNSEQFIDSLFITVFSAVIRQGVDPDKARVIAWQQVGKCLADRDQIYEARQKRDMSSAEGAKETIEELAQESAQKENGSTEETPQP